MTSKPPIQLFKVYGGQRPHMYAQGNDDIARTMCGKNFSTDDGTLYSADGRYTESSKVCARCRKALRDNNKRT